MIFIFKPLCPANSVREAGVWSQLVNNHKRAEPVKATRCWRNIIQDATRSMGWSEGKSRKLNLLSPSLLCLGRGSNSLTKSPPLTPERVNS